MNKAFLCGSLGADAELKVLANGTSVLKFSLATNEKWTGKDGTKQEKTTWHKCNMWGPGGPKLAQYLLKGTKLLVEGSIENGSYEKDGIKMYTSDIKVQNVEFVGGSAGGNKPTAIQDPDGLDAPDEDNVPF